MGLRYVIATFTAGLAAGPTQDMASDVLASTVTAQLEKSLQAARAHARMSGATPRRNTLMGR